MGETYHWFQSKEDGTWKELGQIGGENKGSKDLNLKQKAQDVIGDTKSDYDAYQDGIVKTFNESVDNMWKGGDKSDYRLVRSDNEEIKTRSYVDENINLADPGKDKTPPPPPPPPPPPETDEWEAYYPWIYAAVAIGIASFVIYLMLFGPSPLINKVQQKVS
jgi:hypothetical protein